MKRLHQIVGLMLLVLWAPLASHCTWENVSGLDIFKCAIESSHNNSQDSDCNDDLCSQIEKATYRSPNSDIDLQPSHFVTALIVLTAESDVATDSKPVVLAPLEIPCSWQFTSRTALPPRAPSTVS